MIRRAGLLTMFVAAGFLFVGIGQSMAQTISTDPLSRSAFCAGDSIDVDFTVTGGGLDPGNAFIVQLSEPGGSFTGNNRRILGSSVGTQSGSIRVGVPQDLPSDQGFRLRVVASNPVIIGSDNGSDIFVFQHPRPGITSGFTFTGMEVEFETPDIPGHTYLWYFGGGSVPEASTSATPPSVVYTSAGTRRVRLEVTNAGGCSGTDEATMQVYESTPIIPADVTIITGEMAEVVDSADHVPGTEYWVCPGGKLTLVSTYGDVTVYAEFGSTVELHRSGGLIYARAGAEISNSGPTLAEEGAFVEKGYNVRRTPTLTFDYSNVPANGCPSLAPYTVQIAPDSRGIHTDESDEKSDENYLISAGATLTSSGHGNLYLVESGASLVVRGSNSRIYLKNGASLDVLEGKGHRIFYEQNAEIESPGADPILLPSSGITFVGKISSVHAEAATARTLDIE